MLLEEKASLLTFRVVRPQILIMNKKLDFTIRLIFWATRRKKKADQVMIQILIAKIENSVQIYHKIKIK
jgi:hypothetical protein